MAPPSATLEERLGQVEKDIATIKVSWKVIMAMGIICWGFISYVIIHYLNRIDAKIEEQADLQIEVQLLKRDVEFYHRGER